MRISDWSSDVCSSDLADGNAAALVVLPVVAAQDEGVHGDVHAARSRHEHLRAVHRGGDGVKDRVGDLDLRGLLHRTAASGADRKRVALGRRVAVSGDLGGRSIMRKKKQKPNDEKEEI